MGFRGELYSKRYTAQYGQKTYFFNVKENRFHDVFLSIVESVKVESCSQQFSRSQIAIFYPDWYFFLNLLREMEKSIASKNVNSRTVNESENGKRIYVFTSLEKSRILQVSITEQKTFNEADIRTVIIDSTDFSAFVQHFSETISDCKKLCSANKV